MFMPQEIEVWYVLPALRSGLAQQLKQLKMSQRRIAEALGITESAVSQYLHKKRGAEILNKDLQKELTESAARIQQGHSSSDELYRLSTIVRQKRLLCKIHRAHAQVPKKCDMCLH